MAEDPSELARRLGPDTDDERPSEDEPFEAFAHKLDAFARKWERYAERIGHNSPSTARSDLQIDIPSAEDRRLN